MRWYFLHTILIERIIQAIFMFRCDMIVLLQSTKSFAIWPLWATESVLDAKLYLKIKTGTLFSALFPFQNTRSPR